MADIPKTDLESHFGGPNLRESAKAWSSGRIHFD
jgi:hypothetical protein